MADSAESFQDFKELMRCLRGGSKEAARQIVERHEGAIRRAIRRVLNPRLRPLFDSVDFTQMVWRSFFRRSKDGLPFDTPEELVAFLIGMAKKKIALEVRDRLVRQKHNVNRVCYLEDLIGEAREIPDARPPVDESLIREEQWSRFISRLGGQDRQIVELWQKGLSNPQIAETLGIAEVTVWRTLRKLLPAELTVACLRQSRSKWTGPLACAAK